MQVSRKQWRNRKRDSSFIYPVGQGFVCQIYREKSLGLQVPLRLSCNFVTRLFGDSIMMMKAIWIGLMTLSSTCCFGQEWWELDITGHQGSGDNSNRFFIQDLRPYLHRDPKTRNKEVQDLAQASAWQHTGSSRKRIESLKKERLLAFEEFQKAALQKDSARFETCPECEGLTFKPCLRCQGKGYTTCPVCENAPSRKCRPCDGTGILNEQTCQSCQGSGQSQCKSCHGIAKVACKECSGAGGENCPKCHGVGLVVR